MNKAAKLRTYSISDLAKEFDVTTRTIRFYEQQGILNPARQGQTRIYSPKDRVRLMLTLRGKRLGFSLAESKELYDMYDSTTEGDEKQLLYMLDILAKKQADMQQQLRDIQRLQEELNTAEARCREALDKVREREHRKLEKQQKAG
ncbi:MerR family transcriptional regulator [Marinospirillum alkaliphilum]|uniref:DNA-binding transcriptional regulator, MerR family n=1 Tax=Marinospirillum alkaliphilum DSM 21637 TaxID=1122209 RepID=A0A1K1X1X2_9GAMM|nr:MerR family DNA-binding transcriptional regulator [Marinospirillum alkaliphilum]SFX43614.1 DNA-binding transcriptional regulator, MerR family [Marinospirillum alkaliphilum DSM 21637]